MSLPTRAFPPWRRPVPATRGLLSQLYRDCSCVVDSMHHLEACPSGNVGKKKQSPFARLTDRIQAAFERIRSRNLPPEAKVAFSDAVRSESDIANVVEQRIFHAMVEGHFEKLPGQGKPLQMQGNPHADPAEDLLYRILGKNGFAPEWVELNGEIRFQMDRWRRAAQFSWNRKLAALSRNPARSEELWKADLRILDLELKAINKKVFHYNLIVPFGRQVVQYKLEKELLELGIVTG